MIPDSTLILKHLASHSKDDLASILIDIYNSSSESDNLYNFRKIILEIFKKSYTLDDLEEMINEFESASRRGIYYEAYDSALMKQGYLSDQTLTWYSYMGLLLDVLSYHATKERSIAIKEMFEHLFELIANMESDNTIIWAEDCSEGMIQTEYDYREIYEKMLEEING